MKTLIQWYVRIQEKNRILKEDLCENLDKKIEMMEIIDTNVNNRYNIELNNIPEAYFKTVG